MSFVCAGRLFNEDEKLHKKHKKDAEKTILRKIGNEKNHCEDDDDNDDDGDDDDPLIFNKKNQINPNPVNRQYTHLTFQLQNALLQVRAQQLTKTTAFVSLRTTMMRTSNIECWQVFMCVL
jgi:hypothetical protein